MYEIIKTTEINNPEIKINISKYYNCSVIV